MEPISFKITQATLKKMNKFYDSQMVPFEEGQFLLKAQTIDCDIEVSNELIATFRGENAIHEAVHWSKKLAKKIEKEKESHALCLHHHIGAAETGSNDYIGPLCVVACYVDEENIEFIKNLNITDVESLTNQEVVDYAKLLRERVITSLLVLDNSHYNKMIDNGLNQANIRARLINQALVNVLQKAKKNVEFKVIERYISPKTYFNYLKNEVIVVKDLMFEEHADQQYLAVLAAEIISRYAYLSYYASMTKSLKIKLARGSGSNVDAVVVNIAEKYGEKILTKVVKLNFTDTKKVKAMLKERG